MLPSISIYYILSCILFQQIQQLTIGVYRKKQRRSRCIRAGTAFLCVPVRLEPCIELNDQLSDFIDWRRLLLALWFSVFVDEKWSEGISQILALLRTLVKVAFRGSAIWPLLPEQNNYSYNLRNRTHNFNLSSQHDSRNFIDRVSYSNYSVSQSF